ncbi:GNAT family N-acetyltransferase [Synechococcus sp. Cruz-9H2]|uniref:GNAT family N-acetyltransferase n=1 Tax=unclassified Synechococcus TaxID=2626047 RepID=UPI0020CD027A|nr:MULTISPECIES: GNAT family N-acetyltransferase [unclassified Synechococcus]MCP9818279.1 GNAT family N-acetyltransferase [Synechococcus sp. Cruz-9H2]MCP9842221.1 GNAT family N-acetyltransferase [Synechococcus sp. Edmonson 11F2]MCP9854675.1 GNAT family N-acetyltransferase [Synechococcus sp. Cruz-9C9]MCP9861629.1 GNAT family N-acetyltransferase [Synechococcus sp. Cruz-7E5]MCP9869187.1 GNAT family N-acetyltransferase [Synechococcus sp. Cruz-7B9]
MHSLRPLVPQDLEEVREVYRDAVLSQAPQLYTPEQVRAWADVVQESSPFEEILAKGLGLASCSGAGEVIEAFAVLEPLDRISLLYCRGRASRQGRATSLLRALEALARGYGSQRLRTEASFLSRPLFEREGWSVDWIEELTITSVPFRRFRMVKDLLQD